MAKPEVRLSVIQVALALGVVGVLARAAQVQLAEGARYAQESRSQRTQTVVLPARRGGLYDRSGVPLALTQESFHVGVAPNELRHPAQDAALIAERLGLSPREVQRALRRKWAYFNGPFSSAQVHPLREIRGVHLTSDFTRFYPDPDFARPVLGRPAAAGRPASGIERVLDSLLAGVPGHAVVLRDGQGREYESPARLNAFPTPGDDVYLTLDAGMQDIVERALEEAITRFDADGGDVVALDPRTGEVLAVASRRADGSAPASAFTQVFEPGSTAKIFAAAALLTHHLVTPHDSVWGEHGTWHAEYRTIHDDEPEGWMTLAHAIQVSSNIGVAKFASRLRPDQQYEMLRDFGLGTPTGIEYPAESPGRLPLPDAWSGTTAASLAIGYAVAVTPLQLAQAYGAIANDGVLMQPTLIKRIVDSRGKTLYQHRLEPVRRVVTPEVARQLRAMLRGVVGRGGTGASAALSSYEVAGKTGTARTAGPHGYVPGRHTAVFAAIFPANAPQLVTVVKLDNPRGGYAALSAAPLTREVLDHVLAAKTGALDRARLSRGQPIPEPAPVTDAGSVPYVFAWPDTGAAPAPAPRVVPDLRGLSLRQAVRRLHRDGLNARVEGLGHVERLDPAAGRSVPAGTVVTIHAGGER